MPKLIGNVPIAATLGPAQVTREAGSCNPVWWKGMSVTQGQPLRIGAQFSVRYRDFIKLTVILLRK